MLLRRLPNRCQSPNGSVVLFVRLYSRHCLAGCSAAELIRSVRSRSVNRPIATAVDTQRFHLVFMVLSPARLYRRRHDDLDIREIINNRVAETHDVMRARNNWWLLTSSIVVSHPSPLSSPRLCNLLLPHASIFLDWSAVLRHIRLDVGSCRNCSRVRLIY